MGGKSKPDNSQVVQQQQQQAAEEAAKETARQQRLQTGLTSIKQAFEGSPVMAPTTSNYDWSNFKPGQAASGAPAGYTAAMVPNTPASAGTAPLPDVFGAPAGTAATGPGAPASAVSSARPTLLKGTPNTASALTMNSNNTLSGFVPYDQNAARGGGSVWGLRDASGRTYRPGDALSLTSQTPTGQTTGGFDDAFYNKYKQSVLDYYMPQVDEQYKKATDQATYGLGRSGNLRSSAANTLVADLAKQNTINQAGVRNQADTAAGDLRSQVSTEEQKAVSQLYATEDPEVAANQATAAVRDISLKQPDLSPLSALFNVATIGGANIYKGYQGQQRLNAFNNQLTGGAAPDRGHVIGGAG